jgi:pimeloyl-ACP methyl ester carboxylesterase
MASVMLDFHPVGYQLKAMAISDLDTRDLLPKIRVPTLLVWGEADARALMTVAHQLRDAIPGARLVIIREAGHVSNFEQLAQFNAEVHRFCSSLTTG